MASFKEILGVQDSGKFYLSDASKQLAVTGDLVTELLQSDVRRIDYSNEESTEFWLNLNCPNTASYRVMLRLPRAVSTNDPELIKPLTISIDSKKPLVHKITENIIGSVDHSFHYSSGNILTQMAQLSDLHLMSSPIDYITLRRNVTDKPYDRGDITYASLTLSDRTIAKALGLTFSFLNPPTLYFTPKLVYAGDLLITDEVIKTFTYKDLEAVGMSAYFTDNHESAALALSVRNLNVAIQLGKTVKPDYLGNIFNAPYKWITDSRVGVSIAE